MGITVQQGLAVSAVSDSQIGMRLAVDKSQLRILLCIIS